MQCGWRSGVFDGAQLLLDRGEKRIGVIGRLPPAQHAALAEHFEIRDANADYAALRLIKSDEEIHWRGLAAALTDLGVAALAECVHVLYGVGGTENNPLNIWRIAILNENNDPRFHRPFEEMVEAGGLPGFLEIYIVKDPGVKLSRKQS